MSNPSDSAPGATAPTRADKRSAKAHTPPSGRRRSYAIVIFAVLVFGTLGGLGADAKTHDGKVARGVTIAGLSVGGDSSAELAAAITRISDAYSGAHVSIMSPKGTLDATASMVGLKLDSVATAQAVMAVDHEGTPIIRPAQWARSIVSNQSAQLHFKVDNAALTAGIKELASANRKDPVEPGFADSDKGLATVAGINGEAIDVGDLARRLQSEAETGVTPITLNAVPGPIPPLHTEVEAKAVVDKANAFVKTALTLSVGGKSATINAKTLRGWLTPKSGPNGLEIGADQARIVAELPGLVGTIGTPATQVAFTLVDDPATKKPRVQIIDGQNGSRCCAPDSAQRVAAAIAAGQSAATLDLAVVAPDHDHAWAEGLKIVDQVGTFTTPHPPPDPSKPDRVTNIHLFADAVRGMYIEPGAVFSANERVGKRTVEKGYVDAPVIYNNTFDHDIGGGVSQFATTLFNAAFFGGLDYDEYQSHSEVISRYPYGREATISWPKPDLKIRNTSPYGVLIWTSYTNTSLTVTLYSTQWATGAQTGQTEEPDGPCKKVRTERTRTYASDGHRDIDHVVAIYQPAAGVKCP